MSCQHYDVYEAGGMTRAEFAEHARRCEDCAERAALDGRLEEEVAKMREPVHAPDLWKRIEASLAAEMASAAPETQVRPARRRPIAFFAMRFRPALVAAGAAALVLVVLGGVVLVARRPAAFPGILAEGALARVEIKEREYAEAIRDLEREARPKLAAMDLQMMSLYRDKLAAIDAQIEKCRGALEANPANAHIRQYLLAALQDKREALTDILGSAN